MIRYVIGRLLMLIPVLIAVSLVVYFIVDLAPGDVVDVIAPDDASPEDKELLREMMGLNDPFIVRYFRYMQGLLRGDLGKSYVNNRDVFEVYFSRLPNTLILAMAGIFVAVVIAVPLGVIGAIHRASWKDAISMIFGLLGLSMPNFWLGLLLIIVFSLKLGLFPSYGSEGWSSIVLPAITIGTGQAALIMRTTRSSMLEVIRQDYLRTARAKGVPERTVIYKHALRNALIPIVTVMGTQLGVSLGGAVFTETVFAWPGVGRLVVDAINSRDIPMVTGCLILTTMLASFLILLVDIAYAFIDPRIKARYTK
ncbi:MAG: ABC transporter permease [Tepidanaerobacteraceae bacterium]|jgi:peptide/nickel transport system permease protein|nr:ABC transporter permease [Tepidanaerobacter sp.]HQE05091.1 ABC transporter permease [Tepidanaerobacteraceae bacterium]